MSEATLKPLGEVTLAEIVLERGRINRELEETEDQGNALDLIRDLEGDTIKMQHKVLRAIEEGHIDPVAAAKAALGYGPMAQTPDSEAETTFARHKGMVPVTLYIHTGDTGRRDHIPEAMNGIVVYVVEDQLRLTQVLLGALSRDLHGDCTDEPSFLDTEEFAEEACLIGAQINRLAPVHKMLSEYVRELDGSAV